MRKQRHREVTSFASGLRVGGGRTEHSATRSRALNHGVISTELVQELASGGSFLFIFLTSEKCLFNLSSVFFSKKTLTNSL